MQAVKSFGNVGAFLILLIGLAMTGVTIYAYINSELLFNQYAYVQVLLGADLVILIGSVVGCLGIRSRNPCLICIFQILVVIFIVVFVLIGIFALIIPTALFYGTCDSTDNQLVHLANEAYEFSSEELCRSGCPCALTEETIQTGNYTEAQKYELERRHRSNNGVDKVQDCDAAQDLPQKYLQMFDILNGLQNTFECSQWCEGEQNLYYQFSDVNRGKPGSYCYPTMKNGLIRYGSIISNTAFVFTSILFLVSIANCIICCCGRQQREIVLVARGNQGQYYRV